MRHTPSHPTHHTHTPHLTSPSSAQTAQLTHTPHIWHNCSYRWYQELFNQFARQVAPTVVDEVLGWRARLPPEYIDCTFNKVCHCLFVWCTVYCIAYAECHTVKIPYHTIPCHTIQYMVDWLMLTPNHKEHHNVSPGMLAMVTELAKILTQVGVYIGNNKDIKVLERLVNQYILYIEFCDTTLWQSTTA